MTLIKCKHDFKLFLGFCFIGIKMVIIIQLYYFIISTCMSAHSGLINPWRMRCRVTVVFLCTCLSVTTLAATYFIFRFRMRQYSLFFFWHFQGFSRVAFVKNASFKSYGIIFGPSLPSWLLHKLLMNKRDSDGFF